MRPLSPATATKLFATGFSVGPIVDSLHNQCLLRYGVLPISLEWPAVLQPQTAALLGGSTSGLAEATTAASQHSYLFCSSWLVPPLLGFAYVVLGGLLPRLFEWALAPSARENPSAEPPPSLPSSPKQLQTRAILAVTTTAMIIKLSEFLETHPGWLEDGMRLLGNHDIVLEPAALALLAMATATTLQWALLDRTLVSFAVAAVTAIGGPLAELPFVGHGVWTYLDPAADYLPLHAMEHGSDAVWAPLATAVFGTTEYPELALSSITGPCYFAVAMDAIALGRWFDGSEYPPTDPVVPSSNGR